MDRSRITVAEFEKILPKICDRKTSYDPDRWTPENPLWAHCAIVAVLAHLYFGGDVMYASIVNTPDLPANMRHYWNILPSGIAKDFTDKQFEHRSVFFEKSKIITGNLCYLRIKESIRVRTLAARIIRERFGANALFNDTIYQRCAVAALESTCQKLQFGCVIAYGGKKLGTIPATYNKTIEPLRHLCEPMCCRLAIQSRTEQMLGACGHAEEWALDEIQKRGASPEQCTLYIAGFYPDGRPYIKTAPEHTCLRCSLQMYRTGIGRIAVPVVDRWEYLTGAEAVKTAARYATGQARA